MSKTKTTPPSAQVASPTGLGRPPVRRRRAAKPADSRAERPGERRRLGSAPASSLARRTLAIFGATALSSFAVVAAIFWQPLIAVALLVVVAGGFSLVSLRQAQQRAAGLRQLAMTDELTGLGNQRALWKTLPPAVESALEQDDELALITCELDCFRSVNGRYGRPVGDALLRTTATSLRATGGPTVGRFRSGGAELHLLLPGKSEKQARRIASTLRKRVKEQHVGLPDVTLSCGVAAVGADAASPEKLLDQADRALQLAKKKGPNRTVAASAVDVKALELLDPEADAARRAALELASATLLAKDQGTANHSDDVVMLCEELCERLDVHGAERDHTLLAARLHDIGKVGVPEEVLRKPDRLDPEELELMREHTIVGERILRAVPELEEVATIVRHTHEHFDGSGYPDGIARKDIPLASRIILCADAFHAIRDDRPYRNGRPAAEALAEIRANAGKQFDPKIVTALGQAAADLRRRGRRQPMGSRRLMVLLLGLTLGAGTSALAHQIGLLEKILPGGGGSDSSVERAAPSATLAQASKITKGANADHGRRVSRLGAGRRDLTHGKGAPPPAAIPGTVGVGPGDRPNDHSQAPGNAGGDSKLDDQKTDDQKTDDGAGQSPSGGDTQTDTGKDKEKGKDKGATVPTNPGPNGNSNGNANGQDKEKEKGKDKGANPNGQGQANGNANGQSNGNGQDKEKEKGKDK